MMCSIDRWACELFDRRRRLAVTRPSRNHPYIRLAHRDQLALEAASLYSCIGSLSFDEVQSAADAISSRPQDEQGP